jgi:hypothetical protein
MVVSDAVLEEVRERGFAVVPGFLSEAELAAAQAGMWETFPRPEAYFANPDAYPRYAKSQFAGLRLFPYESWAVNRLAFHPDLVDAAARFLGSDDLRLYKVELWAKYAGAIDYDQPHHRDFGNHSLVVPRLDGAHRQLTTFILLSDVTELDGPTRVVPLAAGAHIPLVPERQDPRFPFSVPYGELFDVEVPVVGPAGSLFLYRTDVLHRGSNFAAAGRSRFALLADYEVAGPRRTGKMAWPDHALHPCWADTMARATVRERALFGFPLPGDPYWNEQTLAGVAARYPAMDMGPYRS